MVLLRRTLYIHHWLGMVLITAGAAIVGAASIFCPDAPHGGPTTFPPPPASAPSGAIDSAGVVDLLGGGGGGAAARVLLEGMGGAEAGGAEEGVGAGGVGGWVAGVMQLHWAGLYAGGGGGGGARHGGMRPSLCAALPAGAAGPLFGDAMVFLAQVRA